jgi:hypothetical protein
LEKKGKRHFRAAKRWAVKAFLQSQKAPFGAKKKRPPDAFSDVRRALEKPAFTLLN